MPSNTLKCRMVGFNTSLTEGTKMYRAVVIPEKTFYIDDVAEVMVSDGMQFNVQEIKYVIDKMVATIPRMIKEYSGGATVHLGNLCRFYAKIPGAFSSKDASIPSGRAVLDVAAGKNIRVSISDMKVENITEKPKISVSAVYSLGSSVYNELEREADVIIIGKGLRISESAPDEGVFLVDSEGVSTKLVLKENNPFQLRANAPGESFKTGNYKLQVRGRDLEDPETYDLEVIEKNVIVVE